MLQKDATIRELTDRLYVGAEQFHRYLTSSSRGADYAITYQNTSNSTYPGAAARADEHRRNSRESCNNSFSDDDSSNASSNDENDEPSRPQQLSVSDLLACKQQQGKITDLSDRSVIGQDDSAYDNPSLQSSSDMTSWSSTTRTVAVIHCQPITVSPADCYAGHMTSDSSAPNAEQRMTNNHVPHSLGRNSASSHPKFAVYQV
jgi:hypothetical protein